MDPRELQEKQARIAKLQHQNDVRWLAQSDSGKRILSSFFAARECKPFSGQPDLTAYNLGRVDFARTLLDDLREADLELYQAAEAFHLHGAKHA
jgi:hypothetical protein